MSVKFLLLILSILSAASALSCDAQWECQGVTTDYNYVQCTSGTCTCRTDEGFSGSATAGDPCRCDGDGQVVWGNGSPICKHCAAPRQIIYQDGIPYCVDGPECESLEADADTNAIRKQVAVQIYQELLGNNPLLIISGQKDLSNLFAADVAGRVNPVGTFDDYDGVLEYFYGLIAGLNTHVPQIVFPYMEQVGDDRVALRVDILLNSTTRVWNLTETGWLKFNSENKVESFDLAILNLGAAVNSAPEEAPFIIQEVCSTLLVSPGRCTPGTYEGSYSDFQDCVSFLSSIPFGDWDRAASNSVVCRLLHSVLTAFRPDVHCPHAGKTGGGKCIDFSYESYYANYY